MSVELERFAVITCCWRVLCCATCFACCFVQGKKNKKQKEKHQQNRKKRSQIRTLITFFYTISIPILLCGICFIYIYFRNRSLVVGYIAVNGLLKRLMRLCIYNHTHTHIFIYNNSFSRYEIDRKIKIPSRYENGDYIQVWWNQKKENVLGI